MHVRAITAEEQESATQEREGDEFYEVPLPPTLSRITLSTHCKRTHVLAPVWCAQRVAATGLGWRVAAAPA